MSINKTMSVITIFTLLVILKHCSGHAIEGCSPDQHKDVVRSEFWYRFKCVDIMPNQHVAWIITTVDPNNNNQIKFTNVAVCYVADDICKSFNASSSSFRRNNTNILVYSPRSLTDTISVTCRVFDMILARKASYINDYTCNITLINSPIMTCSVLAASDYSEVTAWCHIQNILDRNRDYSCRFTEELEDGRPGRLMGAAEGNYTFRMDKNDPLLGDCYFEFPTSLGINVLQVELLPYMIQARAVLE